MFKQVPAAIPDRTAAFLAVPVLALTAASGLFLAAPAAHADTGIIEIIQYDANGGIVQTNTFVLVASAAACQAVTVHTNPQATSAEISNEADDPLPVYENNTGTCTGTPVADLAAFTDPSIVIESDLPSVMLAIEGDYGD
jgi:hypothetical protein